MEVGMINDTCNDGGNPYGANVWRIKSGDERLSKCVELFENFSKNSFRTCNYTKIPFTTGGPTTAICIFNTEEGASWNCVKIIFLEEKKEDYIVEIKGIHYKVSKKAVDEFREQFYGMFTDEDLAFPRKLK